MKIGIISDTHDRLESINKAIDIFRVNKVDMIIHCGDWVSPYVLDYLDSVSGDFRVPIKSIYGNNEGDKEKLRRINSGLNNPIELYEKEPMELEIDGKKIAVHHGDDKEGLKKLIDSGIYNVIFTGHSHQPRHEIIGRTLVVNPGSTSFAAGGRIADKASVAIYDTKTNKVQFIEFTKEDLI